MRDICVKLKKCLNLCVARSWIILLAKFIMVKSILNSAAIQAFSKLFPIHGVVRIQFVDPTCMHFMHHSEAGMNFIWGSSLIWPTSYVHGVPIFLFIHYFARNFYQVGPWLLNSSKFHQKVRRKRSEKKVRVLFLKSTSSTIKRPTSKLKIIVVKFVKNSWKSTWKSTAH